MEPLEPLETKVNSKRELSIKPFDDIVTELLTNENAFNQISQQFERMESIITDLSKRLILAELEINKLKSVPTTIPVPEPKSEPVPEPKSELSLKPEPDIFGVELDVFAPPNPEVQPSLALVDSKKEEKIDKCISPIVFTHNLSPIFLNHRSPNSKGTATFKEGKWYIKLNVEVLEIPAKNTINDPIPLDTEKGPGGYINFLNNQVPVGFSPSQVDKISADRNGIFITNEEAILGYIRYIPDTNSTYPHNININIILS